METEIDIRILHRCHICNAILTNDNVARKDNSREIRRDAFNKLWCQECTDTHDSIDWDKIHNYGG